MSATIIISCKEKTETTSIDIASYPSLEIKNLKVLRTVNGSLKYELHADEVDYFQYADTPYYSFPKGLYGISFTPVMDSMISVASADLIADKAIYKQSPDFFEAYHNVVARNLISIQRLETDTLYWDSRKTYDAIYSHSPSVVMTPRDTFPALGGFYTDNQFSSPTLLKLKGGVTHVEMTPTDSTSNNRSTDSTTVIIPNE